MRFALLVCLGLGLAAGCDKKDDSDSKDDGTEETTGSVSGGGGGSGTAQDQKGLAVDPPAAKEEPNGRKILMVVAQYGFYFKEYQDPRTELEAAGFTVEVASFEKATAIPHENTGQRADDGDGSLMPDLAMADANVEDYDAIVFPGGWGATRYYFGFDGTVDQQVWAPVPAAATAANDLINAFVSADKYVVGICNGVSVLAWSRVDGESLLKGKNATAPEQGSPAQTYKGQHYNDLELIMNTYVPDNGGTLSLPNQVGDTSIPDDDVVVDGKVVTAQNQFSADMAGKKLVELLTAEAE